MTWLEMPITSVKLAIHLASHEVATRAEVAASPVFDPPFDSVGFELSLLLLTVTAALFTFFSVWACREGPCWEPCSEKLSRRSVGNSPAPKYGNWVQFSAKKFDDDVSITDNATAAKDHFLLSSYSIVWFKVATGYFAYLCSNRSLSIKKVGYI